MGDFREFEPSCKVHTYSLKYVCIKDARKVFFWHRGIEPIFRFGRRGAEAGLA